MAAKQIVFSEEARRKLKNGMTVVANAQHHSRRRIRCKRN
jgi:hypothetical protein